MENKKLRRNPMNRVIGGVCSGLADFFGVDVALMRIAFVIAFLFASFGFWLYIILWIVLPESQQTTDNGQQSFGQSQSQSQSQSQGQSQSQSQGQSQGQSPQSESVSVSKSESKVKSIFAGAFIILIGLLFLVNNFIPINWVWKLWPLILVAIGVVMIVTASKK